MTKRFAIVFCLLTAMAATAAAQQPRAKMSAAMSGPESLPTVAIQDKKSLYDRLGGYNAVAAVVDDSSAVWWLTNASASSLLGTARIR
jgi:hypothetical protein